jgi:DNA-binding NarL/FixJ family response regulator
MARLTSERDVVRLVADGVRNQEIALRLNLSEHTVRNYMIRIFDKLGISSRVELVLYAFSNTDGISAPDSERYSASA